MAPLSPASSASPASSPPSASSPEARSRARRGWLAGATLAALVALAYANALRGPFVFDDLQSIPKNETLRALGAAVFFPPAGTTVSGRPLLNLSFALDHALGGENVLGYHLTNVAIHALAAVVLFALLRHTLAPPAAGTLPGAPGHRLPSPPTAAPAQDAAASLLAFSAALLWALHPLQTESVTYLVQRAESLAGLFYLVALYAFARGAEPAAARSRGWFAGAALACTLGMATKETVATAPLVALLYDRVFLARSWREVWRQRRGAHLALAATWLVLALLVAQNAGRAGTAGLGTGIAPLDYARFQARAVTHYLRLAVWPTPLAFDYGEFEARHAAATAWPFVLLVAALLGGAGWLWRRRPAAGFAALAFFLVLAPSSSVVPILTEAAAEHRMYLPLAALAALAVAGLHAVLGRRAPAIALVVALAAGGLTVRRNRDYRSELALWESAAAAAPQNARAFSNLGLALRAAGDPARAEACFRRALALRPDYIAARAELGALLADAGRLAEAEAETRALLALKPRDAIAHNALGTIHYAQGRAAEAARDFERAAECDPGLAAAHNNLGGVRLELGEVARARGDFETALRLDPDYAEAHYNLGNALVHQRDFAGARRHYERALALRPDYAEAHAHLGVALQNLGERTAAIAHYRAALRQRPDFGFVRQNLAALGVFEP
jgi:tetratricopeptide (TPR) repeat protein